jgi:hypothetical protein
MAIVVYGLVRHGPLCLAKAGMGHFVAARVTHEE